MATTEKSVANGVLPAEVRSGYPEAIATHCDCSAAGFCPRHNFTKTQREWELCRSDQRYFDLWESGDSPQHRRQSGEVRSAVEAALPDAGQAAATPEHFPCIHRGTKTGSIACKPCGGGRILDVFSCSKHSSCTIGSHGLPSTDNPPRICLTCGDRAMAPKRRVVIHDTLCPGDITVLTAAVRELHRQYPEQFETDIRTEHAALWEHSPFITIIPDEYADQVSDPSLSSVVHTLPSVEHIHSRYDPDRHFPGYDAFATINQSNQRPIHMLEAYCEGLSAALGLPKPLRPKHWLDPSILLSGEEKNWLSQIQELTGRKKRFWLINAGTKSDYTCKFWQGYQEVVDRTPSITWVQVGLAEHDHALLAGSNVINLIGKTDLRQLVRLVYHSAGVLCGVTGLMHLAHWVERGPQTPFRRPAVIIAGGRESPHWFSYPGHHVLSTVGELDCCESGGCWRSRVCPLPDGSEKNASLCAHPVDGFPLCMQRIDPRTVADLVLRLDQ